MSPTILFTKSNATQRLVKRARIESWRAGDSDDLSLSGFPLTLVGDVDFDRELGH